MTAAEIAPLPETAFVRRPHPDQSFIVAAAKTLRLAVRAFERGNVENFLLDLKRSSFQLALHFDGHTPSETRMMRAINRVAMAAADRLRIVQAPRRRR